MLKHLAGGPMTVGEIGQHFRYGIAVDFQAPVGASRGRAGALAETLPECDLLPGRAKHGQHVVRLSDRFCPGARKIAAERNLAAPCHGDDGEEGQQ